MNLKIEMAPLEGVTTAQFRRVQSRHFTPPEKSYTPFISPTQNHIFTARELGEILPEVNEGLNVVPQLIGHNAEDFLWAANELKEMGYKTVNLNLGCPSGTVTKKKKGAGLLSETELLTDFLNRIFFSSPVEISIKTRVGRRDYSEARELAALFSRYPVSELIVHARLEKDFYTGPVSMQAFKEFTAAFPGNICYNGDIFNRENAAEFEKNNPSVGCIMCGRGFAANPKLAGEINGEPPLTKQELKDFYDDFFAVTVGRLHSEKQILHHLKEYWTFWGRLFPDSSRQMKKLFKAGTVAEYSAAVQSVFSACEIIDPAGF